MSLVGGRASIRLRMSRRSPVRQKVHQFEPFRIAAAGRAKHGLLRRSVSEIPRRLRSASCRSAGCSPVARASSRSRWPAASSARPSDRLGAKRNRRIRIVGQLAPGSRIARGAGSGTSFEPLRSERPRSRASASRRKRSIVSAGWSGRSILSACCTYRRRRSGVLQRAQRSPRRRFRPAGRVSCRRAARAPPAWPRTGLASRPSRPAPLPVAGGTPSVDARPPTGSPRNRIRGSGSDKKLGKTVTGLRSIRFAQDQEQAEPLVGREILRAGDARRSPAVLSEFRRPSRAAC